MKKSLNILQLEDDTEDIELIQTMLKSSGIIFQINVVQTREEFDQAIDKGGFNIILADFSLPMYDGISALRLAKERCPDIPFIFVSGTLGEDAAIAALTEGATDYVPKQKLSKLIPAISRAMSEADNKRERKLALDALKKSQEQLSMITNSIDDVIYSINGQTGEFDYISPVFERKFGYTLSDLKQIGGRWSFLQKVVQDVDPSEPDPVMNELQKSVFKNTPVREYWWKCKDGNLLFIEDQSVPIYEGNRLIRIDGVLRDITARKAAEVALGRSEERYHRLVDSATDYIYSVRIESGIPVSTIHGPGCVSVTGYTSEEFESDPYLWLRMIYKEDVQRVTDLTTKILSGIEVQPIEHRIIHKNGTIRWIRNTPVPQYDNAGILISYEGMITDITERKRTEEILRESEEQFRILAEQSPNMIFINNKRKVIYANPKCEEMMGYSKEEFYDDKFNFFDLIDPQFVSLIQENFKKHLNGEELNPYEYALRRKDGKRIDVIIASKLINYKSERAILGVITDVTERKRIEVELRSLTHAIEQSPVSVIMTNVKGDIEYVNPKFTETTGYLKEEVIGKNPRILKSGEMQPETYNELWNTITSGKEWHGEFHNKKKNGDLFWEAASISPVRDEKGSITNFVAIKEDITERKRLDKELKESEEQFRTLVNTVPDIIIRTDLLGNIIYVNETLLPQNIPIGKILGVNILTFLSPEDRVRGLENIKLMFKEKLGLREYKLKFNSIEFDCEINGDLLRDSEGEPNGMVYVIRDITERKKTEKELENYRYHLEELIRERTKELEHINKLLEEEIVKQKQAEEKVKQSLEKEKEFSELKSKFTSIASHEFRTPLAVIYSSTELLQRYGKQWSDEEFNEQVERVKDYVHHMTDIMDDMLTISRTETGKIKFEPRATDLEQLCLSIFGDLKLLLTPKHNLHLNYMLKQKKYKVDEKLLRYILVNLLSNAIKYSINGGDIDLEVTDQKDNIIFEINDNGIGIPEKDQPYLFEPFHRGENVGEIQGTGLGMSIIKRSVEMHNGSIIFQSRINEGTKFKVTIPIINQ